jgi:hypothetical protein
MENNQETNQLNPGNEVPKTAIEYGLNEFELPPNLDGAVIKALDYAQMMLVFNPALIS